MPIRPTEPKRPWQVKTEPRERTESKKFYQTGAWRKLRNAYIKANPLCAECQKQGIVKAASVVDHITPIRQGGEALDRSNLQSLCTSCHNSKSGKESKLY
jgi:5-methylcytosine-specific restriction protein A